jgi:hypothetical protein
VATAPAPAVAGADREVKRLETVLAAVSTGAATDWFVVTRTASPVTTLLEDAEVCGAVTPPWVSTEAGESPTTAAGAGAVIVSVLAGAVVPVSEGAVACGAGAVGLGSLWAGADVAALLGAGLGDGEAVVG